MMKNASHKKIMIVFCVMLVSFMMGCSHKDNKKEVQVTNPIQEEQSNEDSSSSDNDSPTVEESEQVSETNPSEEENQESSEDNKTTVEDTTFNLKKLTEDEIKAQMFDEFPGDSIPQDWIDSHAGEKLYEYVWGTYEDNMILYYVADYQVTSSNTIETIVNIVQQDESVVEHQIVLIADDEGFWKIESDELK